MRSALNIKSFEEHAFDPALHQRDRFDCGDGALNDYLKQLADQHRRQGITSVYVLVDANAPALILGYYTLSAVEIDAAQLPEKDRKRLPRYPVPCFRMGRLACHVDRHGEGIGKLLLGCAVDRCLKARQQVAAYAVIVDAKDDHAATFYRHFGFRSLLDQALTLYLPLGR
jgi:predicted N-acetyltransferase YhbS